jgi:hypothetical protein
VEKDLSLTTLKRYLEDFSDKNFEYLREYHKEIGNPRGAITPKTKSACRYISLAEEMKLLFRNGENCKLTKYGKILATIAKTEGNPFKLSPEEICFFLKHLLECDILYFIPLISNLSNYNSLFQLSSAFKRETLFCLKRWFQATLDEYLRRRIMDMEGWRKEKKYVENIVPPRLYWCYDLKLVNLKGTRQLTYSITEAYNKLICKLPLTDSPFNFKEWNNRNFFSVFYETYKSVFNNFPKKVKLFNEISFHDQKDIVLPKLEKMFLQEKEFPIPSKVLFSYFSMITCIELLRKEGILCEINHLKDFLHNTMMEGKYFLYWDPEIDDGFIRKP